MKSTGTEQQHTGNHLTSFKKSEKQDRKGDQLSQQSRNERIHSNQQSQGIVSLISVVLRTAYILLTVLLSK
jgi:hypothetical protein